MRRNLLSGIIGSAVCAALLVAVPAWAEFHDDGFFVDHGSVPGGTMTGALLLPDGSSDAPSFSYSADTDTGVYRFGTNALGFSAGSGAAYPRMRMTSAVLDVYGLDIYSSSAALALGGACDAAGSTGQVCAAGQMTLDEGAIVDAAMQISDNIYLQFGTSSDYFARYLTTGSFNFHSTNVDGGGTDGVIWSVADGTSMVTFDGNGVVLPKIEATDVSTPPVACAAGTTGTVVYVDDTDDGAKSQTCICIAITDSTYDWRQLQAEGTTCGFF